MKNIVPHLWYDKEAKAAAEFYTSIFDNSKVTNTTTLHDTPGGDTEVVSFTLRGMPFMAMSAGPLFKFSPSVSFMVNFDPSEEKDAKKNIDQAWSKLLEGGSVLMPLQEYPFSKRYGWVQDKFGLSWQLILTDPEGDERPKILPSLLFTNKSYGKAEEAVKFYLSVFKDSKLGTIKHYGKGQEPNKEGTTMFADFKLFDTWFAAMDGGGEHKFEFNEAISFIVNCDTQKELDHYWDKLSAVPESEQCGWCKDKFGVSWQVQPREIESMMQTGTREQVDRMTQALLPMHKLDLSKLKKAFEGK